MIQSALKLICQFIYNLFKWIAQLWLKYKTFFDINNDIARIWEGNNTPHKKKVWRKKSRNTTTGLVDQFTILHTSMKYLIVERSIIMWWCAWCICYSTSHLRCDLLLYYLFLFLSQIAMMTCHSSGNMGMYTGSPPPGAVKLVNSLCIT